MRAKSTVDESFAEAKKRKARGQRGKSAEDAVEAALKLLKEEYDWIDYDRLPDTRAAGRIMPARVSDFTVFAAGKSFSLEVKEISKGFRLPKPVQLPRMRRREMAGCLGFLLVHAKEAELNPWRVLWVDDLEPTAPSFVFDRHSRLNQFVSAEEAIKEIICYTIDSPRNTPQRLDWGSLWAKRGE